jgi:glycosyltransferase involved in cell wall biosynthesis
MASGKPVVAVDEGGYRETVTIATGIFVKPETGAIIEAISAISRHPEEYRHACEARAREFDVTGFRDRVQRAVFWNS